MIQAMHCKLGFVILCLSTIAAGQVEQRLKKMGPVELVNAAQQKGDARRGASVFHQQQLSCARCHVANDTRQRLGPDLTALGKDVTDAHLIESILNPSKVIREGFETVMLTVGEESHIGLLVSQSDKAVVIRDSAKDYKVVTLDKAKVSEIEKIGMSIMPAGMVNMLTSEQQFFDLVKYLMAIRDGGSAAARDLAPNPALLITRPQPAYEKTIDHRGFITSLDRNAYKRGQKIYSRLCVNCHGTREEAGSLPTSLRFATGQFKNGNDPFTMYQTLSKGFGMMVAQTWMVPSQKYDVIHYIREEYLKRHNPSQYFTSDEPYLTSLPKGDSRGPEPSDITAWEQMDYGPNQVMTLEIGNDASNFAYKGNVVRLDSGPGGISQGRYWMVYDYDTLRVAAAWSGDDVIDWNSIHFNGRHAIHPRLEGQLFAANPTGPGWGRPSDGSFEDLRLVGRDKRIYGPLPRAWAQYRGMYYHGANTLIEYTVGETSVLEMPGVLTRSDHPVFTRTFNIGPRSKALTLQVTHSETASVIEQRGDGVLFKSPGVTPAQTNSSPSDATDFNSGTWLQVADTTGLNAAAGDFTLTARIKTKEGGTILAQTGKGQAWVKDGITWFVQGGKLTLDIGWVGVCAGRDRVADGKWHNVAVSYEAKTGKVQFFIDGRLDPRTGELRRNNKLADPVVRIGYTSENFPDNNLFKGRMSSVQFYNTALSPSTIQALGGKAANGNPAPAASWSLATAKGELVTNTVGDRNNAVRMVGEAQEEPDQVGATTIAGAVGDTAGFQWSSSGGDLRLTIPAGSQPLKFTCWFTSTEDVENAARIAKEVVIDDPNRDLQSMTKGGPPRWNQVLTSEAIVGKDDGPFTVDVLKRPTDNPWFCRMRLTGFDFTDDGDVAIVSAWDGSVWKVAGLKGLPEKSNEGGTQRALITWKRIASGLFQPLGVKIVDGKIYITCRDQLCILHDLNGDEEIDYFECFNNDHQVTDHFHEFAMGLQADGDGNFYYAKSARHAKTALVPHHGTLLKVTPDGQTTEIIANGFRAANGVCINPDGTFIVTDQEGHWNPKNRINYVKKGGFYGNMFGYHDVTDDSDDAMDQPLVWITNSFDRSPGELLWVDSEKWGPLNKQLLNLSYGYGMVYIVPHENVDGQMQGGMCAFPIKRSPTGIMRGRFHPGDGQLYLAGMFAWAGSQQQPGGLYRLRYTGQPVHLPTGLSATKHGVTIKFSGQLDSSAAEQAKNYRVKVWDLKRTRSYGSKHYNERSITVKSARLALDGQTVHLDIPDIAPTWGMEIRYELQSTAGKAIHGTIHNTIHKLKN
jgi:putative heme-binding domain-containing protein